MKKYLLLLFFVFFIVGLSAQNAADAEAYTHQLTQRYQLDRVQSTKLLEIEQRKMKNLNEISGLRRTDIALYLQKKRGIVQSSRAAFKKILSGEQLVQFDAELKAYDRKRSAEIARMKEEGAEAQSIQLAVLDLAF